MFLTRVNELAELIAALIHTVLDAAKEDAENPVKAEEKKGSLLERFLGRGRDDEVGLSGQDVKAIQRESGEGKREM